MIHGLLARAQCTRGGAVVALSLLLGGCAGSIGEQGFAEVAALTEPRLGAAPTWVRSETDTAKARATLDALLASPLGPDETVRVALVANPGLQASLAELGIAAAELAEASRPPNPGFTFSRISGGGLTEIDRSVGIDLVALVTRPFAYQIAERRFDQAKLRAASDILLAAGEARRAWVRAVAAAEIARYAGDVSEAAAAQLDLARRLNAAGNLPLLDYAREQAFSAETSAALARAKLAAASERERLLRVLGLTGREAALKLPERLPDLPKTLRAADGLEATALAERLDVRMARAEVDALARSLGLAQATRFVNVLETSYLSRSATGERTRQGYEIVLEVPLFDFGAARVARAEAIYMQGVHRLSEIALNAQADTRAAHAGYGASYAIARSYRDEILPLRRKISDEVLLRYNGMLASVFELLADAREQIASVIASIEAKRDFFLADAELDAALIVGAAKP